MVPTSFPNINFSLDRSNQIDKEFLEKYKEFLIINMALKTDQNYLQIN